MNSLFLQALLTGILCYLGAVETPWMFGVTGGFYILGRPLVEGLMLGLVFVNVQACVLCGLAVQGVFIANLSTGGATNSEITYASYGGIGLALATTQDPAIAVTLAVLIGQTFGLIFYNLRMAGFSYFNRRAEIAAENLDIKGLKLNQIVYPQIVTFLIRAVPIFLAIFYGRGLVDSLLNNIPEVVTSIISVLGGVLPALGIAMLMNMLVKEKVQLIFFFSGFVLIAFLNINMIGLVFLAILIAYLVFLINGRTNNNTQQVEASMDSDVYEDDSLFD